MRATLLLAVLLPFVLADWNATFTDVTSRFTSPTITGLNTGSIAWGDFNNDGTKDVFVSGLSGSTCSTQLYLNNGTNLVGVSAATSGLSAVSNVAVTSAQWGDYNKDGWLDLIVYGQACPSGGVSKVYKNNGGTFTEALSPTSSAGNGYMSFVDFNSDGWLDVVQIEGGATYFYKNNGDGTFTDVASTWSTGITSTTAGAMVFSDYNRDGKPDLFLVGNNGPTASATVYKNTGTGFTDNTANVFPGGILPAVKASKLAFADFNMDSYEDFFLLGTTDGTTAISKLYVNNKNGTFSDVSSSITGLSALLGGAIAWGDYNGDRYPDLYIQGSPASSKLFRNSRGTSFTDVTTDSFPGGILLNFVSGSAQFGDVDGDGLADDLLVFGSSGTDTTKLYLSSAIPIRKPHRLSFQVSLSGTGSTKTLTVTTNIRASLYNPVDAVEVVVTPNGGKITKALPAFNYKDDFTFTAQVPSIPVLNTMRKVWVRGVNKVGKGEWTVIQVTI